MDVSENGINTWNGHVDRHDDEPVDLGAAFFQTKPYMDIYGIVDDLSHYTIRILSPFADDLAWFSILGRWFRVFKFGYPSSHRGGAVGKSGGTW